MSYQRISLGDPLLLRLQTGDGATNKFPRAHVYSSVHTEVSGSPFSLTHIGNGLYASEAYTPVSEDHFDASYTVYTDSGHTTIDTSYNYDSDSFDVIEVSNNTPSGGGSVIIEGAVIQNTICGEVIDDLVS